MCIQFWLEIRMCFKKIFFRYNSLTIKFTLLKGTTQGSGIFMKLCNYHCYLIAEHFHTPPKKKPVPISSHSHFPTPTPRQLLISCLSLWICLSCAFHMNGIT